MLLRLAYLGVTNVFALLRLLPVSSRDKDAEILALRHAVDGIGRPRGGRAPACSAGVTTARSEKSNKLSERTRSDLAPSVIRRRGGRGPGPGRFSGVPDHPDLESCESCDCGSYVRP